MGLLSARCSRMNEAFGDGAEAEAMDRKASPPNPTCLWSAMGVESFTIQVNTVLGRLDANHQ